jgi:uncharacterized protein (DUF488 family)
MILTCGHSTRSFEELCALLLGHGVTLLVDVRASPKSRFYPHFNRAHLEKHLPMPYLWRGDRLGGKNAELIPPELFAAGIDELIALSRTETVCIMCSEREPGPTKWRPGGCHRWASIAPALEAKGAAVRHL